MDWLRHSLAAASAAIAAPLLAGALVVRPRWREGFRERLGSFPSTDPGRVWVHGASVGEVMAAKGLVYGLQGEGLRVFGSATTLAGRELMRRVFPEVPSAMAPLDHPWCVDAALARVRPGSLVLIETELWPSWIAAARREGLPVVIASGRLSDRSFPRYLRVRRWLRPTLERIDRVGARSEVDAERFVALGVSADRVEVTGDLKLDATGAGSALAGDLRRSLEGRVVFVAGSTHRGEETAARAALEACEQTGHAVVLVVAPRHLSRIDAVERELVRAGRKVFRRSKLAGHVLEPGEVLLLDTVGELPGLYTQAQVAFVGGTLAKIGGHNVLEPVQAGCPVVFGPNIDSIRRAVELVEVSGSGTRVLDAEGLGRALDRILRDPAGARGRIGKTLEELRLHAGSVARTIELIRSVDPAIPRVG